MSEWILDDLLHHFETVFADISVSVKCVDARLYIDIADKQYRIVNGYPNGRFNIIIPNHTYRNRSYAGTKDFIMHAHLRTRSIPRSV